MAKLFRDIPNNSIYYLVIFVSVILGIYVRFKGLGTWPLALDEYYVIKSSENILIHGLPQFSNGGYYSRGILLQYIIAGLIYLGMKVELAGRIISVIANILTIPPLYLLSRKIGNIKIAVLVVIIYSFSIWEIEFSRFARMYTPFQALFLWYIYFAVIDYHQKDIKNYNKMIFLSFISIFVYEGSIFLAVFNFIPFLVQKKINFKYLVGAVITFAISFISNTFSFRRFESNPTLPTGFANEIKSSIESFPIKIPQILMPFAFEDYITGIATILLLIATVYILYRIYKIIPSPNLWDNLSLTLLAILLVTNQFGLFILSFIVLKLWSLLNIDLQNRKIILLLLVAFIINIVFWFGYGLLFNNWYVLFNDFSSFSIWGISKRLFIGFFNYPDNYYSLFNYFRTLPLLTLFSALFMIYLIVKLLLNNSGGKNTKEIGFIIASLVFVILLSTIPPLLYEETRYTFFAAPVLLFLVLYSVYHLSEVIFQRNQTLQLGAFFVVTFSVFIFSRDFNFSHLINIDNERINYRMIYKNEAFKRHLYRRWDIKTPTSFVSKNADEHDIIMINENSLEYYLPRTDYFNFNYKHRAFTTISVEYGTKERWSNAKMIYTNKDLVNFIEQRKETIWFLVYPEYWFKEINFYERYKEFVVFQGKDGMITVFKFPKSPSSINIE